MVRTLTWKLPLYSTAQIPILETMIRLSMESWFKTSPICGLVLVVCLAMRGFAKARAAVARVVITRRSILVVWRIIRQRILQYLYGFSQILRSQRAARRYPRPANISTIAHTTRYPKGEPRYKGRNGWARCVRLGLIKQLFPGFGTNHDYHLEMFHWSRLRVGSFRGCNTNR